ncbi:anti-sigma factor family protein [Microbacterium sp. P06]|uniref:anti-sigma factor family protein n=1 Tax=Microbacterium sp. P06 TaxID=3366949 RepID=UPI003747636F
MNPDHARFVEWDAAFVLGALSATDRRAYEEHLSTCAECTRAVAEVAPTVGLLSRVPAPLAQPAAEAGPDAARRTQLISIAGRRARRRRNGWIAGTVAAAALVVAAIAVPLAVQSSTDPGPVYALTDLADAPLEASVRLTDAAWGTRIDLVCRYSGEVLDAPGGGWPYALAVVDADGESTTLSTWRAAPGSTTQLSAGTDLGVGDIGAVEIRTVAGDRVLMRYEADL